MESWKNLKMMKEFHIQIDEEEVERRCQMIRNVWNYRRVEHIPIHMTVAVNPYGYTVQEHFLDGEKQLRLALANVKASWEAVPNGDYIPGMRPDIGCSGPSHRSREDGAYYCNVRNPLAPVGI